MQKTIVIGKVKAYYHDAATGRKVTPVFHDDPECWSLYEPYLCFCPDTGRRHHNGLGEPCEELTRLALPAPHMLVQSGLELAAYQRLICNGCGCALIEEEVLELHRLWSAPKGTGDERT